MFTSPEITEYRNHPIYPCENINASYNRAILDRNIDLVHRAIEAHSQVLLIRFDVRYPSGYIAPDDNSLFQRFIELYSQYLRRQGFDPRYLWCREQSTAVRFHYHCYFLLDGTAIRYMPHLGKAKEIWSHVLGQPSSQGLIHYCNPNGSMIHRGDRVGIDKAIEWLGYLAKLFTKLPVQSVRTWGSSVLR